MHETARCIGYPSDSTRAARERGRGSACGHRPCRPGPARPAWTPSPPTSPLAPVAQYLRSPLWFKSHARPCGSSLTVAPVAQVSRSPQWLKTHARPCGSSLTPAPSGSTLAGVGQCPTATGHGCPAGLRAGVPDRRPVSPLSSSLGVQWGGLGPGLPYVDHRLHRVSRGPGDGRSRPSHVRG